MADPELGTKQVCPSCEAKFYDLKKRPATCPKCAHSFDPEDEIVQATKTKVRAKAAKAAVPEDDDEDPEEEAATKATKAPDDEDEEGTEEAAKELGGDEDEVALNMGGDGDEDEESTTLSKVPAGFTEEGVDDDEDVTEEGDSEEFDLGDDIDVDDDNQLGEPDAGDAEGDK